MSTRQLAALAAATGTAATGVLFAGYLTTAHAVAAFARHYSRPAR